MEPPDDPLWRRWDEVDRVFTAALDLPREDREPYVAELCRDDLELRETVLDLLAGELASAEMFEGPDGVTTDDALIALVDGGPLRDELATGLTRVGPYRILREVGRGGMGTIYLAERTGADFEQRVAVKVLRRGLDTDDIVHRFLSERRILAGLEHPSIAQFIDGGSTEDGRPYLVMQFVEGLPITDYCEAKALRVRQRVELFLRVAEAVRYAHARLVMHRDLKPSNILVTAAGAVKLLDFGIAKLISPEGGENALTRTGLNVMTPQYASPEQLRGEPVTTASDIYQLGVLLHVLLTGISPFDRRRGRIPADPRRHPPPPSFVGSLDPRLRKELRGDLDTIVSKALHPAVERRYESAADLIGDLRAHLEARPISARRDSLTYRAGKLLRRQIWIAPTAAAGVLFAAIFIGSSVRYTTAVERERNAARAEAERASEVQRLMIDLFRSADPFLAADDAERGREITVIEALDLGAERVLGELEGRPRVQVGLLEALAEVYTNLGGHDKARPLAERALRLHEELHGPGSAEYRAAIARLASATYVDPDSALTLFQRRLDLALAASPEATAEIAEARVDLAAHLKHALRRLPEAEAQFARVLALADSVEIPILELAEAYRGLADLAVELGRPEDGVAYARRAVELHAAGGAGRSPYIAMAHATLATALAGIGDTGESEVEFRRAVGLLEETLGPDHGSTLNALNNLALLYRQTGDFDRAAESLRRLVESQRRVRGDRHRAVGTTYQNLGAVLTNLGRVDEAAAMHRRAAAIYEEALDEGNYLIALPQLSLAGLALQGPDFPTAEAHARRALRVLESALPPDHYATAVARCRLGRSLAGRGLVAEARPHLEAAAEVLRAHLEVPEYREECLQALGALSAAPPPADASP